MKNRLKSGSPRSSGEGQTANNNVCKGEYPPAKSAQAKSRTTNSIITLQKAFPCIHTETLDELTRRGLLHVDGDKWRFGDESNGTTRKLNTRHKWIRGDHDGAEWHRLIGLDDVVRNDRPYALLVIEGSKDALAAAQFALRIKALPQTGIMCALGSGYRPIPSEMHKLAGRFVSVIGDNDVVGIKTTQLVSFALNTAGVEHQVWDWSKCEIRVNDLFDFWVHIEGEGKEKFTNPFVQLYPGTFFFPSPPSESSSVHGFMCSCNKPSASTSISDTEMLGIVAPHIMTQDKTSNCKSFDLARAIKPMKLDMKDINEIFKLWFDKSRPFLPPDAKEAESLAKFYRQLKRVRFTETALNGAIERARKATPPFIAARDGDIELARAAALCRELQRNDESRPFICPVTIVVNFVPLRWRPQANYLLHILEDEGVIECVDRGLPHGHGQRGKPTMWRYKLPMD
jgi:hypothetical protein